MAKLYATVNGTGPIELERGTPAAPWTLVGNPSVDLVRTGPGQYSLVLNGRSHRVLVLKEDRENNLLRVRVGSRLYTVQLEDGQQHLMHALGLDRASGTAVREIKAPMPGLVLKWMVKEGDTVKKNDPLLILEAMKMENVIKSPGDGRLKRVHVQERSAVEKGALLLSFD
jgi:biotin carboxyl carrier protein